MTGATKRVKLAIEPVVGKVDGQVDAGVDAAFARMPDLVDVGPDGTRYYDTADDQSQRSLLSTRLTRLWQERGDFSLFSAKKLEAQIREEAAHGGVKHEPGSLSYGDESYGWRKAASTANDIVGEAEASQTDAGQSALPGMTLKEFNELKGRLLQQLVAARHSASFAEALVSMLQPSTKPSAASAAASSSVSASVTGTDNALGSRARAGSPAGSSSAGHRAAGSMAASANTMPASLVEELGLDPHGLSASALELDYSGLGGEDADSEADAGEALVEDAGTKMPKRARLPISIQYLPPAERADEFKIIVANKRATIRSAAEILLAGSRLLSQRNATASDAVVDDDLAEAKGAMSQSTAQNSEQFRYMALLAARKRGWGLTPGRVFRQGWSGDPEKEEALWTDEGPHRREDGTNNGARDAWIGWGIGEAPPAYRSRTLAFVSDASPDKLSTSDDTLVFPDRPCKRLRVSFIVRRRVSSDGSQGDGSGMMILDSDDVLAISGEHSTSVGSDALSSFVHSLDESLQAAQNEMADQELFDDLVRQARALSLSSAAPSSTSTSSSKREAGQGKAAVATTSSLSPDAVSVTANRVELTLTANVNLLFELVPTSAAKSTAPPEAQIDATTHEQEQSAERLPSGLAALVLSLARLGLVRRYRRRAGLTKAGPAGSKESLATQTQSGILRDLLSFAQYASLSSRLHEMLVRLATPYQRKPGMDAQPEARLYWDPTSSMPDSASWLGQLVEGSTYAGPASGLADRQAPSDALGGHASLWIGDVPIANITLQAPSHLTVHFPRVPPALSAQLAQAHKSGRSVDEAASKVREGEEGEQMQTNGNKEGAELNGQAQSGAESRGAGSGEGLPEGVTMSGLTLRSLEEFITTRLGDVVGAK